MLFYFKPLKTVYTCRIFVVLVIYLKKVMGGFTEYVSYVFLLVVVVFRLESIGN